MEKIKKVTNWMYLLVGDRVKVWTMKKKCGFLKKMVLLKAVFGAFVNWSF